MSRVALLALTLTLVAAPGGAAQTGATLDGETLNGEVETVVIDCAPTGTSTVSYAVAGVAVGPFFPGTFEEWGSYTIVGGLATDFQAAFVIESGDTRIEGTKTLLGTGAATCTVVGGFARTTLTLSAAYEATITSPLSTFADAGTVSVNADMGRTAMGPGGVMQETFASDGLVPTTGRVTGGGSIDDVVNRRVSFAFSAKSDGTAVEARCLVVAPATDTHVRCLGATLLARTATHATFVGPAEVNGDPTTYRIDVDDLGEPGQGRDTFKIQAGSFLAAGVLAAGNVQIHDR